MVDPDWFLMPRQTDKMMVRSDLVHQFVNHLAGLWRKEGHVASVRAEICKSLNRRPYQAFMDPRADLTTVEWNLLRKDIWVLLTGADNETCVKNMQFQ
jgi:vitamin K-dependent gamma-carboxylase